MYCVKCGVQLPETACFCPHCGCPRGHTGIPAHANRDTKVSSKVIAFAYIGGAIVPFLGWIMAVYLLAKGEIGHAVAVTVVSFVMIGFWVSIAAGN